MSTKANNYYTADNTRYVFIDGLLCNTMDKVYATLQSQLSIPEYFGNNLDALEEVLADLEWVEEEVIKLVVINSHSLLVDDLVSKENLLSILSANDLKRLSIEIL